MPFFEKPLARHEVYYLLKLVKQDEKSPSFIDRTALIKKLQDAWISHIHNPESASA
jgi:hypothetical protein